MEALLKRQLKSLETIESIAKQDRMMQLIQTKEQIDSEKESEKIDAQLADMNKTLKKGLLEKNGDSLNSNVIKLFDSIKKVAKDAGRDLNKQEIGDITGASQDRRQFNTVRPRVDALKDNVKDLFTMRGFLDKTGIAKRGSGGLISEYLDRAEEKKKYVDNRMQMDPTARLHGDKKAREIFAKQFDKQQEIQYDISRNEKKIKEYKDQGFTEEQIARSPEAKKRAQFATELAKADTRVRPEGFDPKTGKVKEKETPATAIGGGGKVIPFPSTADSASLSGEENMLEQNRMVAEQGELLKKIEENTRVLKSNPAKSGEAPPAATKEEDSGGGLLDMLGNSKFGRVAKNAGRGLLRGAANVGKFALRRAGPLAAAAAVAGGAYTAYTGYNDASDKESGSLKDIDAKVASGEISEDQAKAMRVDAREQGTVDRSGAVGEGTGQAIGGAAGALKGAAVGAAIGSAVPIVGTVIGGAIGATVGAIGGSYLGGKGGKWLGEKFGKAKNWLFGKSGESDAAKTSGSSVSIQFSESDFAQKDPETYAQFAKDREELAKKYADEQAKKFGRKEPSPSDRKAAMMKANTETIEKYRKQIEAAGAGKVTGGKEAPGDKTESALKKSAEGLTGPANGTAGGSDSGATLGKSPEASPRASAAVTPSSGSTISNASGQNESAKLEAGRGGTANIVSAPTINNSQNVQNQSIKLSPRNTDSTVNKYLEKRYA